MSAPRDPWLLTSRAGLGGVLLAAAQAFPRPGEEGVLAVHGARKELKRAASLARWFAPIVGGPAHVARDAANAARRAIGRVRDLDVLPQALEKVKCAPDIRDALIRAIARERGEALGAEAGCFAPEIIGQLEAAAIDVGAWDLSGASDEALLASLRDAYRSAKRRGRGAFAAAEADKLHRLRQGVVDLGHQLQVLAPAWPAMIEAQTGELHKLRQALGDFNDLTILAEFALSRRELDADAAKAVAAAALRRRRPLERRARKSFERAFAERPGAFARRLAAYLAHPQRKRR